MKPAVIVAVLALIGLGTLSTCSVHRLSAGFACNSDSDCNDNARTCDQGFCVERANGCPSPCSDCDPIDKTCLITCSATRPCGSVQCPLGFDCTIKCNNANACSSIDCAQGASCDISCSGPLSCGSINCGSGPCNIDCSGTSSCQTIDCARSCACDVRCNNQMACPPPSCPSGLGLSLCTRGGVAGATCDSSEDGCDLCL